jgi:hypothetical protein
LANFFHIHPYHSDSDYKPVSQSIGQTIAPFQILLCAGQIRVRVNFVRDLAQNSAEMFWVVRVYVMAGTKNNLQKMYENKFLIE